MKNLLKYSLLLTWLVILTTSCITQKYQRPKEILNMTDSTITYRDMPIDTNNIAQISWMTYYEDPYLLKLIQTALDSNFNLKIAESRILSAQYYLQQAKAQWAPSFNLDLQGGINFESKNTPTLNYPYNAGIGLSWEIDLWGKIKSEKNAQKAKLLYAETYRNFIKTQIISTIATAYFELLSYDAQLALFNSTIENRTQSLKVLKLLKKADQNNEIAVNQGAAQLYYAQAYLPQIQTQISKTENAISLLIGKAPQTIERQSLSDIHLKIDDILKIGIPAQLLSLRPDVQMAEADLIYAHQQLNIAKASMYPSLTISGEIGYGVTGLFGKALVGLLQPLFNNLQLRTQKKVAEQTRLQSIYMFQNTLLTAQKEVSDALISYNNSLTTIEYQKKQVDELKKAIKSSYELLVNGYANYLDLLYAEDNALSAGLSLIEYYLQNYTAKVELYRALGGGWK